MPIVALEHLRFLRAHSATLRGCLIERVAIVALITEEMFWESISKPCRGPGMNKEIVL